MDDHHTRNTELWVVSKLGVVSSVNFTVIFFFLMTCLLLT